MRDSVARWTAIGKTATRLDRRLQSGILSICDMSSEEVLASGNDHPTDGLLRQM